MDPNLLFILDVIEDEEERNDLRIIRKNLRDVSNPLTLPENLFRGIYRLSRGATVELMEEISPHLPDNARTEIAIPKLMKVLATLHFLAQGSYQKSVAQDFDVPMAQQTLSKCIKEVTYAMVHHLGHYIKFPTSDEDQNTVKQGFVEVGGFPGIIGAIDCTHIAIQAPPFDNPEIPGMLFLNRNRYYSLNTQIIVDSNLKILAVNAKFPGSVHDSAIWTTSAVKMHLEQSYLNGNTSSWLIGDSGYPLQPFLMTPIPGQNLTPSENNYNRVHKSTRNVIERLNGVLKSRFRCCFGHRTLHYKPAKATYIIYTCCILHNFLKVRGDNVEFSDDDSNASIDGNPEEIEPPELADNDIDVNWLNTGRATRNRIINNYFN